MKIIALVMQKGGAGKSTLAQHLAVMAAAEGPTVLIDADEQRTTRKWGKRREQSGREGPEVIALHSDDIAEEITKREREGVAFLFIDTPGRSDVAAATAAELADLLIVPLKPATKDIDAIQNTKKLIDNVGVPHLAVITQAPTNSQRTIDEVTAFLHSQDLNLADVVIHNRLLYMTADNDGSVAQEIKADGKEAEEVTRLWTTVKAHLAAAPEREASPVSGINPMNEVARLLQGMKARA
jgi:chromosome partitioning protein